MKFQTFLLTLTVLESLSVLLIIITRCYADPDMDQCEDLNGKSLSYLLDWRWLRNMAAVLLGGASFLNVFFAFFLLYPNYKCKFVGKHLYMWGLRVLHVIGFVGVAFVGVFDLNDYHDLHIMSAGWLFILLCIECELLLFLPDGVWNISRLLDVCTKGTRVDTEVCTKGTQRSQNGLIGFIVQIIHAQLNWVFIVLYVRYNYGPYEWIGIWGILLYLNWFSREYWNDEICVLVHQVNRCTTTVGHCEEGTQFHKNPSLTLTAAHRIAICM